MIKKLLALIACLSWFQDCRHAKTHKKGPGNKTVTTNSFASHLTFQRLFVSVKNLFILPEPRKRFRSVQKHSTSQPFHSLFCLDLIIFFLRFI